MGWVVNATPLPLFRRELCGVHCVGGWIGPRANLDGRENLASTSIRSPDRPAHSEWQFHLRYSGPNVKSTDRNSFLPLSNNVFHSTDIYEIHKTQRI